MATTTGHKDYSGTPLPKKLGVKEGSSVLVVGAPEGFVLPPVPGVELRSRPRAGIDVVLLFVTRRADLERRFGKLAAWLDPAGRLWVAWPKRSAKVDCDLDFAIVQRTGLAAGLVDNKSASIDETFQGLQFVRRVKDRPRRRPVRRPSPNHVA
ncbi:MAG TPA: hypothetical protein VK871_05445 [Candidatus Limnocylindrales bacterium]|nr:hypothetical protein [Candidatus Limnocylindrales bacterium]